MAFFITFDQIAALQALETPGTLPRAISRATWQALVNKALVTLDPAPRITPKGSAFLVFNRTPDAVNRIAGAEEGT